MNAVSAQVLLKTKHGQAPADADLTVQRIAGILPSQPLIDSVTRAFATAGFNVGNVVGLTFSITGAQALFESFFKLTPAELVPGGLSLAQLPAALSHAIAAVVISASPAFGPGTGFAR